MPEARHLNPYFWHLSYAAGYPQTDQLNCISKKKETNKKFIHNSLTISLINTETVT